MHAVAATRRHACSLLAAAAAHHLPSPSTSGTCAAPSTHACCECAPRRARLRLYEQRDGPHTLGTLTLRSRVSTMSNCKWARGASSWVSEVRAVAHPFIVVSTSLTNGSSLPTDCVTTTALTCKLTKCVLRFCNPRVTAVPSPHCSRSERATASSQTQTLSASAGVTLTRLAATRSRSRTRCPPSSGSPCAHLRRCRWRTLPSDTSPSTPPPPRRPLKGRARLLVPVR